MRKDRRRIPPVVPHRHMVGALTSDGATRHARPPRSSAACRPEGSAAAGGSRRGRKYRGRGGAGGGWRRVRGVEIGGVVAAPPQTQCRERRDSAATRGRHHALPARRRCLSRLYSDRIRLEGGFDGLSTWRVQSGAQQTASRAEPFWRRRGGGHAPLGATSRRCHVAKIARRPLAPRPRYDSGRDSRDTRKGGRRGSVAYVTVTRRARRQALRARSSALGRPPRRQGQGQGATRAGRRGRRRPAAADGGRERCGSGGAAGGRRRVREEFCTPDGRAKSDSAGSSRRLLEPYPSPRRAGFSLLAKCLGISKE